MNIPSEWAVVRLKDIVLDTQPGFAQRPGEEEEVGATPQIRTHNVSPDGQIDLAGIKYVTLPPEESSRYRLKPQDIIFNNTNSEEWVGKTALFESEGDYVFSNHMTRIRANLQFVEPEYLTRYLHFLWQAGYSRQRSKRWVSQAAVDQSTLIEFKIPLPTLPEQQRIVAILRQAEELRRLRREFLEQTQQLSSTLFLEMFGDPVTNPKGWKRRPLGEMIENIDSGWSPSCLDRPAADDEWGVLKLGAVTSCRYLESENKALPQGLEPDISLEVKPGDLLFTRKNTYDLVAACALVFSTRSRLMLSDLIFRFRLKEGGKVMPEFLWASLTHPGRRKQVQALAGGSAGSMPNISKSRLLKLRIENPPDALQEDFALRVRAIHKISEDFDKSSKLLDDNFTSLRQRAFSGDLSSTWRNSHLRELDIAVRARDTALGQVTSRVTFTEHAPLERPWLSQPERSWLLNHLGEVQGSVWEALREWKGTLIPSDDLEDFREKCFSIAHLANDSDHILRSLSQLAGLGFITQVSVPNQQGEYVVGYRGLREGERVLPADIQSALEPQR